MGFWRVLYRGGRTIGHLTVGEFTVTGVPLFLFAFLMSSWKMDGKAERRWLGASPCDNERTIALRTNALRAYEGKSPKLIPPGPRSRVGTYVKKTKKNGLRRPSGGAPATLRGAAPRVRLVWTPILGPGVHQPKQYLEMPSGSC